MRRAAVLAPGFGGGAQQHILRSLARALAEVAIDTRPISFSTRGKRPSRGYESELADLRAAYAELRRDHDEVALVGRSFGGRMCAFLAEREPPDALVIVGHPIAPPERPRPHDEEALTTITCPTLVVQGDRDERGPLAVLERIAGRIRASISWSSRARVTTSARTSARPSRTSPGGSMACFASAPDRLHISFIRACDADDASKGDVPHMTLARSILALIAVLVVGAIGYQIGITQSVATQLPAAASGAPIYYGPHMFGWGWGYGFPFFGFLFPLLFFFLFIGLVSAAFRGGHHWGGGYGHDWRRQRLEEIHRELHGEKPPAGEGRT